MCFAVDLAIGVHLHFTLSCKNFPAFCEFLFAKHYATDFAQAPLCAYDQRYLDDSTI